MMNILYYLNTFIFLLHIGDQSNELSSITISNLRCEYLINPLGIDVINPRLSWELISNKRAQSQFSYQILVDSDSIALNEDKANTWNSNKVESGQTSQLNYGGKKLKSGNKYYWKVRIWDKKGNASGWSPIASWSMGLLNQADWQAKWIGAVPEQIPNQSKYYIHYGYHSAFASTSDSKDKWVVVDIGSLEEITQIKLYPVDFQTQPNGYLFPNRFLIEVSGNEAFNQSTIIADESGNDYEKIGMEPYIKDFAPVTARFIKVSVSKLANVDSARYAFAMAELEVLNNKNENLALHKKVTASDVHNIYQQFSTQNWLPERLTDGFLKPNSNHQAFSLPVPPSPLLRKTFSAEKKVKNAVLYSSALGLYEISINGKKVGNQVLAPEWTDYHTRVQYQIYNVSHLLQKGINVISAILADGWYAGSLFSHPDRGSYGFDRRYMGQLEVEFEDGSKSVLATDESWKILENGPIQMASIFDGETFDARLIPEGWGRKDFDDAHWGFVTVDNSISKIMSAQMNEPIRVIDELVPVKIIPLMKGTYIFDMGQNIAGWISLHLPYNPGTTITIRHGEVLDDDGKLYTDNLRGAKQIDVYIPGNETVINYEPKFTYHGFRYVEISGLTKEPEFTNVTGKVVASASPLVGSFETSSTNINKLWENILWTQRGNMHSIPTDCPQRDERAGWMGDAQVFSQTAIFNLDMAAFFTKWIRDIRDSQTQDGRFPDYAPQVGTWINFYNSPGWGDAGVITPWRLYENYGDITVLVSQYNAMKDYIKSIHDHNPNLLWKKARGNMYGDWLNGNTIIADDYPKEGGKVSDDIYSTAFFAYSTKIVSNIAKLLDKKEDINYYDSLATAIKQAFNNAYVSEEGTITGNTQAGYALALDFDLVPENLKAKAAQHMVEAIKAYDYRISTGIQTTIRLMNQLTAFGYSDVAYRLIESHRFPSWMYSIDQGATTIWERWDGYVKDRGFQNVGMNSFNHYAIGAVGEWMYRSILGINNDRDHPGYKHFTIQPIPGGTLTWARGSYHSIAGTIAVSWKKKNKYFLLDVEVPVNTTATVVLPHGKSISESGEDLKSIAGVKMISSDDKETKLLVQSGKYSFKVIH
ncbi:MAG: glycoside hydrolase family 78 protein [Bacteroidota bacterium]|nr:glycoside hydrolase family 78 protein [Bacteroidota bacterium]